MTTLHTALLAARACIEQDRTALADTYMNPVTNCVDDPDGLAGLAEYDAVLAQIEAALTQPQPLAAPAAQQAGQAPAEGAEKLLRDSLRDAVWCDKRTHVCDGPVLQHWKLEVYLPIPADSGMSAAQALDRALGKSDVQPKGTPATFDDWWAQIVTDNGGAEIGADYRHWAQLGAEWAASVQAPAPVPAPSPTAGMTLAQRILHVGGRNNAAGYVEFGSTQAVEALIRQVLRDLPATQAPAVKAEPVLWQYRLRLRVPTVQWTDWKECTEAQARDYERCNDEQWAWEVRALGVVSQPPQPDSNVPVQGSEP